MSILSSQARAIYEHVSSFTALHPLFSNFLSAKHIP